MPFFSTAPDVRASGRAASRCLKGSPVVRSDFVKPIVPVTATTTTHWLASMPHCERCATTVIGTTDQ